MPTTAELLAALPVADDADARPDEAELARIFRTLSDRPVPTGQLSRLVSLGGLSSKLGLAYFAYWIRSWYLPKDKLERKLLETHLRSALNTLETMGYLRGAVSKFGQLLSMFPESIPAEFVDTLSNLQFQAPPMHFALIREQLLAELGDPQDVFAEFNETAAAAASIGQVHRARLKSGVHAGNDVAVKIQYPGIARTIRSDLRSLRSMMRPFLYHENWRAVEQQFDELRHGLELETDYENERRNLNGLRPLFADDDEIIIPKVYDDVSTGRILTMDYLEGRTLEEFLATDPSQDARDHFGLLISRAVTRCYLNQQMYTDAHPGNFIFMDDGRLGFIDFGNVRKFTDEEWKFHLAVANSRHSDDEAAVREICAESALMTKEEAQKRPEVVDLIADWLQHYNEPIMFEGKFDYGDPAYLQRGADLMVRAIKENWVRQKSQNVFAHRLNFQMPAILFQLKSRVNVPEMLRSIDETWA